MSGALCTLGGDVRALEEAEVLDFPGVAGDDADGESAGDPEATAEAVDLALVDGLAVAVDIEVGVAVGVAVGVGVTSTTYVALASVPIVGPPVGKGTKP